MIYNVSYKDERIYETIMTKTFEQYREKLLNDPEFVEQYDQFEPEYQLVRQIIEARIEQKLTQKELAQRIGTKQSNIARLESGTSNPSLQFLKRVAQGLGKNLSISFK